MAPAVDDGRFLLSVSTCRAPVSTVLLFLLLILYPPKQLRMDIHSLFLFYPLTTDPGFKSRLTARGGFQYFSDSGVGTEVDNPLGFGVQISSGVRTYTFSKEANMILKIPLLKIEESTKGN